MTFFKFLRSRTPILKPAILVLLVCFLQFGCEKNNLDTLVDEETQLDIKPNEEAFFQYVTNKDIPNVINSIKSFTGSPSSSKDFNDKGVIYNDKAYVDFNKGMKVKDTEGITNYTFGIFLKDALPNELYNLIQTEDAQGNLNDPYVIKYVLDDDALDDYLANKRDFSYFKGTIHIMSFSDFFDNIDKLSNKGSLSCGETVTPLGSTQGLGFSGGLDDISSSNNLQISGSGYSYPSYTTPVAGYSHSLSFNNYNSSINQYTSSYASTVTNSSASTVPITVTSAGVDITVPTISGVTFTSISVTTYTNSSQGTTTNPDGGGGSVIGGESVSYVVFTWKLSSGETIVRTFSLSNNSDKQSATSKFGCPDSENSFFAINDNSLEEVVSGKLGVSRYNNTEVWEWLNKDGHPGAKHWELFDLYIYLNENTNEHGVVSPEAVEFGLLAIDAFIAGGEVDFDNEIIKDPSFIGTKADCVLKALISSGNNIFKKTVEAFTGNRSKFKLKFIVKQLTRGGVAAQTPFPTNNENVIEIQFDDNYVTGLSIDLASIILHESIHAELHRIRLSNNNGPNALSQSEYTNYMRLWSYFQAMYEEEFDDPFNILNATATAAQHYHMSNYYINPIAQGLREFDSNMYPIDNYKFYAWEGLEDYGKQAGDITQQELDVLSSLRLSVINDNHVNQCD